MRISSVTLNFPLFIFGRRRVYYDSSKKSPLHEPTARSKTKETLRHQFRSVGIHERRRPTWYTIVAMQVQNGRFCQMSYLPDRTSTRWEMFEHKTMCYHTEINQTTTLYCDVWLRRVAVRRLEYIHSYNEVERQCQVDVEIFEKKSFQTWKYCDLRWRPILRWT
jgi:hypothetical protein